MNDNHLMIGKTKLDPLADVPDAGEDLFRRVSKMCNDYPVAAVINGCSAVMLNAIRQRAKTRQEAEAAFDELHGRMKSLLLAHYDGATGRRRNIFPHHQVIDMAHFRDRK